MQETRWPRLRLLSPDGGWKILLRQMATIFFWVVLLLALLDYGAVGAETIVVSVSFATLTLVLSLAVCGMPQYTRGAVTTACLIILGMALVVYLQTTPHPSIIDPHPAWKTAKLFTASPMDAVTSLAPADDRFALLAATLPFLFFITGLVLFDTDERALNALRMIALVGVVLAVLSLLQFLLMPGTLLFDKKLFYKDSLTGMFVNRNTAATFFGILLLTLVALTWRSLRRLDWTRVWILTNSNMPLHIDDYMRLKKSAFFVLGAGVIFVALLLTQSRGGVGASFGGLLLLILLMALKDDMRPRTGPPTVRRQWLRRSLVALVAIVVMLGAFGLFSGQVLLRAAILGGEDGRFCVMPGILALIGDNMPRGIGLASFAQAYAPYHNPECGIDAVLVKAHNVYLEGLATLGIAFIPLIAVPVVGLAGIFVRGILKRKRYRFAGHLGLATLLLVLLHSVLDFSLQIPGFAMMFAVLLAPLVTICLRPNATGTSGKTRRRPQPGP